MGKQTWNKIKVIKGILDRENKSLSLTSRTVRVDDSPLMVAARRYFGGWAEAIDAAGINYENIKSKNQTRIFWDKDKIVNSILVLSAKQQSLRLVDVKKSEPKLVKAAVKWFGGWHKAVKAAELDYDEIKSSGRNYRWNKDLVKAAITKRHEANLSLSSSTKDAEHQRLVCAALRHFGSWPKAIKAAGIDYDKLAASRVIVRIKARKWDKEKIINFILSRLADGLALNYNYMANKQPTVLYYACEFFGSWKQAIEAAGFDYNDVRAKRPITKWGKENVVKAIQKRFENKLSLASNSVQQNAETLYGAARNYFGSWSNAVEAAGFSYADIRLSKLGRVWDKKDIVKAIKQRKRLGLPLNGEVVAREEQSMYRAAFRHFGKHGWKNALLAAGVNPKDVFLNRKWTKKIILRRIKELYREGRPLYAYALKNAGEYPLVAGASMYFGSWRKAIEAAGLKWRNVRGVKKHKWWTKNRVIARIKYLHGKGVQLNSKFMHSNHGGLHGTARKLFGSWSQAVYAAGIDYLAHCQTWSSKAWLRNLKEEEIRDLEVLSRDFAKIGGKNGTNRTKKI